MYLVNGDDKIEVRLKYSRRRTMEISIDQAGKISVSAPLGVSKEYIRGRLEAKSGWIFKKLEEIRKIRERMPARTYSDGDSFMYLGEEYPLKICMESGIVKPRVELRDGKLNVCLAELDKSEDEIRLLVENWYRDRTQELAFERVRVYQSHFQVRPTLIKAKRQRRRWGSCTAKRAIYLNLRCAMAPVEVFDYVLVHEMSHMVHMDHSRNFWSLVGRIIPDYRERRKWLKEYGVMMGL